MLLFWPHLGATNCKIPRTSPPPPGRRTVPPDLLAVKCNELYSLHVLMCYKLRERVGFLSKVREKEYFYDHLLRDMG